MGNVYKKNAETDAVYQLYLSAFEMTAPASVEAMKTQVRLDGAIYNLRGQRVTTPGKGLYIRNGKKFFVK